MRFECRMQGGASAAYEWRELTRSDARIPRASMLDDSNLTSSHHAQTQPELRRQIGRGDPRQSHVRSDDPKPASRARGTNCGTPRAPRGSAFPLHAPELQPWSCQTEFRTSVTYSAGTARPHRASLQEETHLGIRTGLETQRQRTAKTTSSLTTATAKTAGCGARLPDRISRSIRTGAICKRRRASREAAVERPSDERPRHPLLAAVARPLRVGSCGSWSLLL
jgi:hypothetical protein